MKAKQLRWLALPLAVAVQTAMADNLVTDGGFESGSLLWLGSSQSTVTLNSAAAFSGQGGLHLLSANNYCVNGALYTLDASQFQQGTLYEFGARTRLGSGTASADLRLGLIKNGASPVYLDGYASTSKAYPDRWTRLFGAYIADFAPTDSLKLCVSSGKNIPTYLDDVFVRPLTTSEIGYQPPATLDYENLVQADGNRLVVGSAKTPILLKGINIEAYNYGNDTPGGEVALDNFGWKNYDESSFQEISSLGFNTVRLMMSFVVFEDNANPGVYKEEGWAWLDRNIQWAKKHNLRLLLDMHEPPGGTQLPNKLSLTPASQKRLEDLWVAIAQRYRNEPTVLGFDLINEPYIPDWFAYAPQLISKIRAVDPNHLVFIEQSYHPADLGNNSKLYVLPFPNIVYDIHYYDTFASSDNGTTPYKGSVAKFKSELVNEFAPFYDASTDSFTVPLNSGEYGVVHQKYAVEKNLGAEQWMKDLSAAMDYYGINRMMFAYSEGRFGLYRGWHTYPGESTTLNTSLQALIPTLNKTVQPPPPPPPPTSLPNITTTSLPQSTVGTAFSAQATVTEGTAPYTWSIASGSLPNGLSLSSGGLVSGTPSTAGTFTFTLKVSDSKGLSDTQSLSMTVTAAPPPPPATGNADMALTKFKATSTKPKAGAALGFNFVLKNNGKDVAKNARFVLPMPANTIWVSGAAECVPSTEEVVCSFGDLKKGQSRNRYIYLRPAVAGSLSLTAAVTSDTGDGKTGNNAKTVTLNVK
ncbi:MAG: cellulase family glycosylhydrolase [Gammaproteobacteria bacterium]|nr:cellulase family glycosylhydrolase [Gammaproteobacteria bacterium]MBU1724792.1 cellulase family glycosylhydrolase [Gammaproteobacteria bacterium]MBU2006545.1 cellulase family glycosylhydrolase [Gammaproteobacteria bacterium]